MSLPIKPPQSRLPHRFPVGAKYVVEGYGGEQGPLRVIARYVLLPGGRRINVPADPALAAAPRALPFRRRPDSKQFSQFSKQSRTKAHPPRTGKRFTARRGTV
jgi:hypothetical protein